MLAKWLLAPQLIYAECANIIWKHVRQGKLPTHEAAEVSLLIEDIDIEIASMRELAPQAISFSLEYDHPAYDSFYLALAVVQGCPFVTADHSFVRKIRQRNRPEASLCVLLSEADSL